MARRSMSILRERKLKLSTEIAILEEINVEDFKTKDIQKKFLDKKLRLGIRLEEVAELLVEEEKKRVEVKSSATIEEWGDGKGKLVWGDSEDSSEIDKEGA